MTDKTWATPLVGGTYPTLDSLPAGERSTGNFDGICNDWNGGCVDQTRNELILALNGGHSSYDGNEVYACKLDAAAPAWARLTLPSTPTIPGSLTGANQVCNYVDGLPMSDHTFNLLQAGEGRIWHAGVGATDTSPDSFWSTHASSFNRATLQWTNHGVAVPAAPTTGGWYSMSGGTSAYDPVGKRLWVCAGYAVEWGMYSINADPASGGFGAVIAYNVAISGAEQNSWMVVAPDLRLLIRGSASVLSTQDLTDPAPTSLSFVSRTLTGTGMSGNDCQPHYHSPSRALFGWHGDGANIRRLSIPSPLTDAWVMSTVTPNGGGATPGASSTWGTYGRFNILNNIGGGRSAFCLVNSVTGPTYVYKIPAAGM